MPNVSRLPGVLSAPLRTVAGCVLSMGILGIAGTLSAQESDRVIPVEGRTLTGTITAVTANGITIEVGGRVNEVEPSNIKMVTFANEPRDVVTARRALAEERLNNALEALEPVDATRLQPAALAADVRFMRAYCIAKLALTGEAGTLDEAAAAIGGFVASDKDSYRYFEAVETFGDVLVARGVFDQAEAQFGELVSAPWSEMQQRGRLKVARTQELQKKFDEAVANYEAVMAVESATASSRQAKLSARVGLAPAPLSRARRTRAFAICNR
ncbi:MAG: tetratricopeptide repeat protein [Pirellulaceae bacterium]